MRRFFSLMMAGLGLLVSVSVRAELDPRAVAVEPGVVMPGQNITLHWYFTGTKVMISGGRFGKGLTVTGKSAISDKPLKTTRYTFDVWYRPAADPAKPEEKPELTHVQYNAVAAVDRIVPYRSSEGWTLETLKGWHTDSFSPEAGSKVYYFQPEDDAVERVTVASLPAPADQTAAALMEKVRGDVPSHYTAVEFVSQFQITQHSAKAEVTTFRGIDQSHPNTKTTSVVMAVIVRNRAYVISGRTPANQFKDRQALIEGLVRSFDFGSQSTH